MGVFGLLGKAIAFPFVLTAKGTYHTGKYVLMGGGVKYSKEGKASMGGILGALDHIDLKREGRGLLVMAEGIGNVSKGLFNSMTVPIARESSTSIMQAITGRKLDPIVGLGLTAGALAVTGGMSTLQADNKLKRGKNIGVVVGPGITTPTTRPSKKETEEMAQDSLFAETRRSTLNNYGATGDIVFALNNQR